MDNFITWIKENRKIVIISFIGMIILSVLVGFMLGIASRHGRNRNLTLVKKLQRSNSVGELAKEQGEVKFIIPDAIGIEMSEILLEASQDDLSYILSGLKPRPIKLSELISNRNPGENSGIKPIIFNGEEMNIITNSEEILEP